MENTNNNLPINAPHTKVLGTNTIKATPKEVAKQMANSKQGEAPDVVGKMTGGEVVKTKVLPVGTVHATPNAAPIDHAVKLEPEETPAEALKVEEAVKEELAPEDKDRSTARFAALAKKERQLELSKTEHNKIVKEFEAKKTAHDKEVQDFMTVKNNPKMMLQVLENMGVPFNKLAEYVLNPEAVDSEYEHKKFRETYEKDKTDRENAEKENALKQQETGINNFKAELKTFLDGNNEAYELIVKQNKYDLVYDVMNEQFKKDNTVMDRAVAAQMVEDFLTDEVKELLKAKKLSNLLTPSESSNESTKEVGKKDKEIKATNRPEMAKTPVGTKTLTNLKATFLTDTRGEAQSDQERRQRALAAFKKK